MANVVDNSQNAGISIIKFSAAWCGPCKRLEPTIVKLESEFPEAKIVRVDVDDQPEIAQKYRVRALPTLLFLKDGQEVNRVVGLSMIEPLRKIIRELLNLVSESDSNQTIS